MIGFPPKISGLKVILLRRSRVIEGKVLASLAYVNEETSKDQAWIRAKMFGIFIEESFKPRLTEAEAKRRRPLGK